MVDTFYLKKGDTKPALAVTLLYANGSAIDLTGGSVFFNLAKPNYTPYTSGAATITSASGGQCEYRWTGSPDTYLSGTYWAEFEVIWTGSRMTFPPTHSLKVEVAEDYT